MLGAFRGEFGKSVRGMEYVCTQDLKDVIVWQEQMGAAGLRGRAEMCGGLVGGGSESGDWSV